MAQLLLAEVLQNSNAHRYLKGQGMRRDKTYYEILALMTLRQSWTGYTPNFIKSEKPDWINLVDSIGIEVCRAIPPRAGRTENFFSMYHGKAKEEIPEKALERFEGWTYFQDGKLRAIADGKGLADTSSYYQNLIMQFYEKLNKFDNYQRFSKNCFYFFLHFPFKDEDIQKAVIKLKSIKHRNTAYISNIFIDTNEYLYILDDLMSVDQRIFLEHNHLSRNIKYSLELAERMSSKKTLWDFEVELERFTSLKQISHKL
jgi:hypothetical protein